MAILLLADHDNATLSDQTAKALTAASRIGPDVHVLVAGSNAKAAAEQAAKLSGVAKVLVADDASLANNLAEPLAALIVSLAGSYDAIVSAATSVGKNVLPRVAALLDVAQVSEIGEVVGKARIVSEQNLGDALKLGGRIGRSLRIAAGDEHMHVGTDLRGCRQRLGGLVGKGCVVVICQKKNSHCRVLPFLLTARRLRS